MSLNKEASAKIRLHLWYGATVLLLVWFFFHTEDSFLIAGLALLKWFVWDVFEPPEPEQTDYKRVLLIIMSLVVVAGLLLWLWSFFAIPEHLVGKLVAIGIFIWSSWFYFKRYLEFRTYKLDG